MRRRSCVLWVLVALALLAAGCGDDSDDAAGGDVGSSTEVDEADADSGDTSEPPEGRGIVTENADGTRTVISAYGEAVVPAEPERIVSVLGYIDFETMLALDVQPVGAGTQGGSIESGFAPHLDGLTDGIEPLSWLDGAPVEAIAALEPDLIFAPDAESAALLDDLAPVVPGGAAVGAEWKDDFQYIADVLGRGEEARDRLDAFETRAKALAEELAPEVDGLTFLSPQVSYDHANVFVDGDDMFSSVVLRELGLDLAPVADGSDDDVVELSFEQIERLDADVLFWQVRQADDGRPDTEGMDLVRSNPLFERLPAVAAGTLFEVENRPWYFSTILSAERILDDVEAALLP